MKRFETEEHGTPIVSPEEQSPSGKPSPSASSGGWPERIRTIGAGLGSARKALRKLAAELTPAQRELLEEVNRGIAGCSSFLEEFGDNAGVIFERNPHPMMIFDPETLALVEVNEAAVSHYGYSRDEFLGMTLRDIRPREDIAYLEKTVARTGEDRDPHDFHGLRHRRKDGTTFRVDVTARSIQYRGKPATLAMAVDITERLRIEEELRASELRFRTIADTTNDVLWEFIPDQGIMWLGDGITKIFGYPRPEQREHLDKWAERIHPEDRDRVNETFSHALDSGEGEWRQEFRFLRADDSVAHVLERARIIRDEQGAVHRVGGGLTDITERTEIEQRFRLLADCTNDALWDYDAATGFLWWSEGIITLFGYPKEQVLNSLEWWTSCIHPEDREVAERSFRSALAGTQETWREEYRFLRADGSIAFVLERARILRDANGKALRAIGGMADITQRRAAMEAMRRSELAARSAQEHAQQSARRTQDILDSITEAFFTLTGSGTITTINRKAENLLGLPREKALGKEFWEAYPPANEMLCGEVLRRVITSRKPESFEEYFQDRQRWVEARVYPSREGISVLLHDITERKAAENALRESEHRFRSVFEADIIGLFFASLDGPIQDTNDAFLRMLGYTREDFERDGLDWQKLTPPKYQQLDVESNDGLIATGRSGPYEKVFYKKDGSTLPVLVGASLFDREKRLGIGFVLDISVRKEAENALRESELRFRSVFESSIIGIFFAQMGGKMIAANDAFLNLLGYTREEFERDGLDWRKLTPPKYEQLDAEKSVQFLRDGYVVPFEKAFYRKDGAQVPILLGANLLDLGEPVAIGFVLDISERNRARQALISLNEELEKRVRDRTNELERARDEANEANRSKNDFLSRMSHELRTPMNAILGFAQILEMQDLSRDQKHCVKQIMSGGKHLLNLINEILDIARIESGSMVVSPEPIVLRDVLRDSLQMVTPSIESRNIDMDWDTSGCENTWVIADPSRLKQVFINLLSNAIKYNRKGGTIRLSCEHLPGMVLRVHFIDNGMGISPDKLTRLFTPFDRLGQEASGIEGSGLGLALSKRLLDVMKGRIHVSSVPGRGTNVTVDLRRIETPIEQEPERTSSDTVPLPVLSSTSKYLVLYIEDNLSNVSLVERMLAFSPSIELITATEGGAGLQIALDESPDLILLDLNLPDMGGQGVLTRIRSHPRTAHTPVAIISADVSQSQVERLLAAGAQAYLTKPLDVRVFLSKVYELLQEEREPKDG